MAKLNIPKIDIAEMTACGAHLGHRTSRLQPEMDKFVIGIRNTTHVIDLAKTASYLEDALKYIAQLAQDKKVILFVGTKTPLRNLMRQTAEEVRMPYVVERWLGGAFTNFKVIKQRAQYFESKKQEKIEGKLDKYTKKERIKIEKELADLEKKFSGIEKMEELPEAVFINDIVKDDLALKEARMEGIKTIAIVDTNANPRLVDYPIPANDDAISSVGYILDKVKQTIINNQ